ncbi:MAG: hypothetical protein BroJett029_27250 [Alphaproteobacteria bacterium]|nr:MAG: hypothetical protein BroJett029_27250 [Alphaproteobacteria bacterium]
MQLIGTDTQSSPRHGGFTRVTAEVRTDRTAEARIFWFDLPSELDGSLSSSGDPWAVLMLPWACHIGEPVRLDLPVDALLLDRLHGIQQIWRNWFPGLSVVPIDAPVRELGASPKDVPGGAKTGAFFSGGIDSLFTLLRHNDRLIGDGTSLIDDLICVAGFNTSLDDFDATRASLAPVAESFGKRLVPIATNLRYSSQKVFTPYSDPFLMIHLAHGAALAAIGHLLGGRYSEIIIAATQDYARLEPWGSHPFTDPLFGARRLRVTHDGAAFNRVERTLLVAGSDAALAALQVCWRDRKDGNCSRCRKCLRTMATLDLVGAKERAVTFDWTGYDMETLSKVWLHDSKEVDYFLDIAEAARSKGRDGIEAAAMRSIRFSRRKQKILALINSNPVSRGAWQVARQVRGRVRPSVRI